MTPRGRAAPDRRKDGRKAGDPGWRQKKRGPAGRGPADPLAFVRCLRPVLALGGWGARKPSNREPIPRGTESNIAGACGARLTINRPKQGITQIVCDAPKSPSHVWAISWASQVSRPFSGPWLSLLSRPFHQRLRLSLLRPPSWAVWPRGSHFGPAWERLWARARDAACATLA